MYRTVNASRRLVVDSAGYIGDKANALYGAGVRTVARYLPRTEGVTDDPDFSHWKVPISRRELREHTDAGLDVTLPQWAIRGEPDLDGDAGERVGRAAHENARALDVPEGAVLWCDCEWNDDNRPTLADATDYLNRWSYNAWRFSSHRFRPGLYVSRDLLEIGFTAATLWELPYFRAYWKSASYTSTVNERGFVMLQSLEYVFDGVRFVPYADGVKGARVDLNLATIDGRGDYLKAVGL